jgi:hypothetical protein
MIQQWTFDRPRLYYISIHFFPKETRQAYHLILCPHVQFISDHHTGIFTSVANLPTDTCFFSEAEFERPLIWSIAFG